MRNISYNPVLLGTIFILMITLILMLATIASAQDNGTNQLHACVNSESRLARFVDPEVECRSNEYLLVWNIVGPLGPQGPVGPQGEQGPQGEPGTFAFAGLHCPEGESIVGFDVDGTPLCTNGPIGPEPSEEICDGVDNDLDEEVDEGFNYCINGALAPNTNGLYCLPGFLDTNGIAQDGCENTGAFSIDEITPASWGLNIPPQELYLTGPGIVGARFYVDQSELNILHVDENLEQVVLQTPVVGPGEHIIRAEKMGAIATISFFVIDPPRVSSISPTILEGGCGTLDIFGENFTPYTRVQAYRSIGTMFEAEVGYYPPDRIAATFACSTPLPADSYDLVVTNGLGQEDYIHGALVVPQP